MKQFIYTIIMCLSFSYLTLAQEKVSKPTQTIKTDKNAEVTINTQNVNLELDTWNKDYIEIEAGLSSASLSQDDLEKLLKEWDIDIAVSGKNVTISSQNSSGLFMNDNALIMNDASHLIKELEFNLSNMPEINLSPSDFDFEFPEIPELPDLPELTKGNYKMSFDMAKYKKEGQSYLKKWSKNFGDKYGANYQKQMENWANELSKLDLDAYKVKINKTKSKLLKELDVIESRREALIERKQLYKDAKKNALDKRKMLLEDRLEKRAMLKDKQGKKREISKEQLIGLIGESHNNTLFKSRNKDLIKTIKIKLPKKAKINLNVKHGELKLSSTMTDLKADLAYTNLTANRINGGKTSINTSYSNVNVNYWNSGELHLNYVDKANLKNVNAIVLNSNASKVFVNNLIDNAVIISNYGDLTIKQIEDVFTNIKLDLHGSDTLINVPENNFNLVFKGSRSKLNNESVSTKTIRKNNDGDHKSIVINAKFSSVYTN